MSDTRTPTRVSNACDRCRRHKQRCDEFRPCTNCQRARTECMNTGIRPPVAKKTRLSRPPQQEGIHEDARTMWTAQNSASILSERYTNASSLHRSATPRSEVPDNLFNNASESHASSDEAAGAGERSESSVLAGLSGADSAMDITKKILASAAERVTFAIPGGYLNRTPSTSILPKKLVPVSQILGCDLPSRQLCDALIDVYFQTVHWFSLVVYEPKFRARYHHVMENREADITDRSFLMLLLMVLAMGCWYGPGVLEAEMVSATDLGNMRAAYIKIIRLSFIDLIDEECLEFVQLCALLGSYWLYWGKPRSSFSILGAATKTSQALGLHRDPSRRLTFEDAEERKRVWWTIYTWDRFATTIYGRPLGINDKDCNISMPVPFQENVNFLSYGGPAQVCLSEYQMQLNRVYQIASPLLENIFGIRYSTDQRLRSQMPATVTRIDQLLRAWQNNLPLHLSLDRNGDVALDASPDEKMYRLQALSLELTFDNLMIVIHRPLLADQSDRRFNAGNLDVEQPSPSASTKATNETSFERCLDAALRISKVHQNKRALLALARRTHLVSFLGMNLFTSSVIMFICALSNTLSDIAQEAKRGLARNLKTLKLLSSDGSLSMQCSTILEDLVQMIVDKEKQEMLRSLPSEDDVALFVPTRRSSLIDGPGTIFGNTRTGHGVIQDSSTDSSESAERLGYPNTSATGGFEFQKAMASLQKVVKDVTTSRSHFVSPEALAPESSGLSSQIDPELHQYQWGERRSEQSRMLFGGSNFNTEDLGQFWLWDMDPYVEDVSTWNSGGDSNAHSAGI